MERRVTPARPHHQFTDDGQRVREVLTYTRRGRRFSASQQQAWDVHRGRWLIPDEAVDRPDLSLARWFGREAPLVVEIGSGVGEATVALAATRPSYDVLAFEVWQPGVAETFGRLEAAGVENVRLCGVDGVWAMQHVVAASTLSELWTFFPDPWHKKRHHKRRLVTPEFARLVASRLVPGGAWRLSTDWPDYAEWMVEVLDAEPGLTGGMVERWGERPETRFERKGRNAGRASTDLRYRRVSR